MEWLARYFCNPANITPIDMSATMCVHGLLDFKRIQDVKAVNGEVAKQFYKEAKNDMEKTKLMNKDSLCFICIRSQCRNMKLNRKMITDAKIVTECLKEPVNEEGGFWVGKNTLKKWRTYAREELMENIAQEDIKYLNEVDKVKEKLSKIGTDVIASEENKKDQALQQNGGHNSTIQTNGNGHHIIPLTSGEFFNSDIICPHGNLCSQEARRKLVSIQVWEILSGYFEKPMTFPKTSELCPSCITNEDKARLIIEKKKEIANSQKNLLSDILNERNRPTWARATLNKVYLIPRT